MPASCSAYGCTNRYGAEGQLQFFSFPLKNQEISRLWVKALGRANFEPTKWSRLCSAHFTEQDYLVRPGIYIRRLKPTAVPSIFVASSTYKNQGGRSVKVLKTPNHAEAPCPLSKKKHFKELISNTQALSVDISETLKATSSKVQVPLFELSATPKAPSTNVQTSNTDPQEDPLSKKKCLEVLSSNRQTPTIDLPVTKLIQTNEKYVQTIGNDKETIVKLRNQVKMLQQKLRRRDNSICKVKELLQELVKQGLLKSDDESSMLCYFKDV